MWVAVIHWTVSHDGRRDLRVVVDVLTISYATRVEGVLVRALSLGGYVEKPLSPKTRFVLQCERRIGPILVTRGIN